MAGLIYLSDTDDLDSAISSKFGDLYATYSDDALVTVGIDVVQVKTYESCHQIVTIFNLLRRNLPKSRAARRAPLQRIYLTHGGL